MRELENGVNVNNTRNANNTKQSTLAKVRAAQAVELGNEKMREWENGEMR